METKGKREPEEALYEPIREFLHSKLSARFGDCHLEIMASGRFEETLKKAVRHDIIFAFLGKKASPDLAGFTQDESGILAMSWLAGDTQWPRIPSLNSEIKV